MRNETRLAARLCEPWAIYPPALNAFLAMDDDDMPVRSAPERKPYEVQGGVAVVPLCGVMIGNPDMIDMLLGACSTPAFAAAIQAAATDATISAILIDADSPGGEIGGCDEAADAVLAASSIKPVVAYTGGIMASAAYWVCSQADLVYTSRAALTGSIGAYAVIRDFSKGMESEGIKTHVIKSGERKGDGVIGAPISDTALAEIQERVDYVGAMFRGAVNRRRKIAAELMDGRGFNADAALAGGIVDAVCGFNKALADAGTLAQMRLAVG